MNKQSQKKLMALSGTVGDFIRYWGFRRIHGEIWTQIYLSSDPLSGADLTERLGVSKALVSPALKELLDHKLIVVKSDNKKTKRYYPQDDVLSVIRDILKNRELKMIEKAASAFDNFKSSAPQGVNINNLKQLEEMITVAQFSIKYLISQSDCDGVDMWKNKARDINEL